MNQEPKQGIPSEPSISQIRSRIARAVSHPGAIEIKTAHGVVTARGPVLEAEQDKVIELIRSTPGVIQVENRLTAVRAPRQQARAFENRFAFQPEFLQASWSAWFRVLAAGLGAALAIFGLRRRGPAGFTAVAVGAGLLARGATNLGFATLFGTFINPVVRLRRSLDIHATVDEVYDFFKRFENFPRFMSYVHEVHVDEVGGLQWTLIGPGGVRLQWNAAVTALIPRQLVSWKSLPRSLITNAGTIQMHPIESDLTRVDVELIFAPPAGALGYAVARFIGFDPKDKIDEDLSVMKDLIEESSILRAA